MLRAFLARGVFLQNLRISHHPEPLSPEPIRLAFANGGLCGWGRPPGGADPTTHLMLGRNGTAAEYGKCSETNADKNEGARLRNSGSSPDFKSILHIRPQFYADCRAVRRYYTSNEVDCVSLQIARQTEPKAL